MAGRDLPRKRDLKTWEQGHGGAPGAAGDRRERFREVGRRGGRELGGCGGPQPWEPCFAAPAEDPCCPVLQAAPQGHHGRWRLATLLSLQLYKPEPDGILQNNVGGCEPQPGGKPRLGSLQSFYLGGWSPS